MTPVELVMYLNAQGVRLQADDSVLVVDAPKGILDDAIWDTLAEQKPLLFPLLVHGWEVCWRAAAMASQVPDVGPVPFMVARESVEPKLNECHSCGDPLNGNSEYICGLCSRAKNLALDLAMSFQEIDRG